MFALIYKKLSVGRCLKDFKGLFHLLSKDMIASLFSSLILHLKRFGMNTCQPLYDSLAQNISNIFLLKAPVNLYLKRLQNNQRLYHIVGSYILRLRRSNIWYFCTHGNWPQENKIFSSWMDCSVPFTKSPAFASCALMDFWGKAMKDWSCLWKNGVEEQQWKEEPVSGSAPQNPSPVHGEGEDHPFFCSIEWFSIK